MVADTVASRLLAHQLVARTRLIGGRTVHLHVVLARNPLNYVRIHRTSESHYAN